MSIRLAKKVGFCFGVRRAVEMAEEVLKKEKKAYSLGSIIHNAQVVRDLAHKGLKVVNRMADIDGGCVVVSSHGIGPGTLKEISERSLKIVDTTCPFVRNAQKMARSLSGAGYRIIIVGDANHPEVKALTGFCGKKVSVIRDYNGLRRPHLKANEKVGVLSQTTQSMDNFLDVVRHIIDARPKELRVYNTICADAEERQLEATDLARRVDIMLIVGGAQSANTKRLYDVCKKILAGSYHIETEKDLKDAWFRKVSAVGITSGASTPDRLVRRVAKEANLKLKFQRKEGCKR